jgi:hypothetical protein
VGKGSIRHAWIAIRLVNVNDELDGYLSPQVSHARLPDLVLVGGFKIQGKWHETDHLIVGFTLVDRRLRR